MCLSIFLVSSMSCLACVTSALRCLLTSTEITRTRVLRTCNVRYLNMETSRRSGRDGSKTGAEYPITILEGLGGVTQTATTPVVLLARQDSVKDEGFIKPQPSPKDGINQAVLRENLKSLGHCEDARPRWQTESNGKANSGSFQLAERARLQDNVSTTTIERRKKAINSSRSTKASANLRTSTQSHQDQREPWQTQKRALSEKFGCTGWMPRKRLSPDTLEGIRALHAQYPDRFTTPILAEHFKVSPEAIRRILKSKWRPKDEEEDRRRQRWEKRGENIWSQMVEVGIKPPKKWREMGVGKSIERKPAPKSQLESQTKSKSKTPSRVGQSTTKLGTIAANVHGIGSPVLLADRIL